MATILACVQDRLDGLVRLIPAEEYANSRMFGLNTDRSVGRSVSQPEGYMLGVEQEQQRAGPHSYH